MSSFDWQSRYSFSSSESMHEKKENIQSAITVSLPKKFVCFLQTTMNVAGFSTGERKFFTLSFQNVMRLTLIKTGSIIKLLKENMNRRFEEHEQKFLNMLSSSESVDDLVEGSRKSEHAVEMFFTSFSTFFKNLMIDSGYAEHEMDKNHPSYASFISSSFIVLTELYLAYKKNTRIPYYSDGREEDIASLSAQLTILDKSKTISPIIELVSVTRKFCVYRLLLNSQSYALKILKSKDPNIKDVDKLDNELKIGYDIVHPALRASLLRRNFRGRQALLLEWVNGIALNDIIDPVTDMLHFLSISREIMSSLLEMHRKKFMHLNLSTKHVIIGKNSAKIISSGFSTNYSAKIGCIYSQDLLEKDLKCISPEQAGRGAKAIDFRSDFYSLGVILYKLLTGMHPFELEDSFKLVHMHLFEEPVPVFKLNAIVPRPISDMISKLMRKDPSERYQSAIGIMFDLDLMISELISDKDLNTVTLGQHDRPDIFLLPQKLYGRDREYAKLSSIIENFVEKSFEFIFISGESGTGKSRLVKELHKSITRRNAISIFGKFDVSNQKPLSAILQAVDDFCDLVLLKDKATVANYKSKIVEAVGDEGKLLTDQIGNLRSLIGEQCSVSETYGEEARNRFNCVLVKFFKAICSFSIPIVLILEDLHWIDRNSQDFLSSLLNDKSMKNILVIFTSRDVEGSNENTIKNFFNLTLTRKVNSAQVQLENFCHETVNLIISDALQVDQRMNTYSISAFVYEKTNGNPFFVSQTLKSLADQSYIYFCNESVSWKWDTSIYEKSDIIESVLQLLRKKIKTFHKSTQEVLKVASCLCSPFPSIVLKKIFNNTKGVEDAFSKGMLTQNKDELIRFSHDQIQQAAYSLLPKDSRKIFFYVAQKLAKTLTHAELKENILTVVKLFRSSKDLVTCPRERSRMASFYVEAGIKLMSSTAFVEAFNILCEGLELLDPKECWEDDYNLSLKLHDSAAKASYCTANEDKMNSIIEIISKNVDLSKDLVCSYHLKIKMSNDKQMYREAIRIGKEILDMIDDTSFLTNRSCSDVIKAIKNLMKDRSYEDIVNMPIMKNDNALSSMLILNDISSSSYFLDPNLFALVTTRMVELTFTYGLSYYSCVGFCAIGSILSCLGDDSGFHLGEISLILLKKNGAKDLLPRVYITFYGIINTYSSFFRQSLDPFVKSFKTSLEVGTVEFAAISAFSYASFGLFVGKDLQILMCDLQLMKENLSSQCVIFQVALQTISNLTSDNIESPALLKGKYFNIDTFLQKTNDEYDLSRCFLFSMIVAFLFYDYNLAYEYLTKCRKYIGLIRAYNYFIFTFYEGMILLAARKIIGNQHETFAQVENCVVILKDFAKKTPQNFLNKSCLLEAELHAVQGRKSNALTQYENSILLSKQYGFINDQALACERAGLYFMSCNEVDVASKHLFESLSCYESWSATEKANHLMRLYPSVLCKNQSRSIEETCNELQMCSEGSVSEIAHTLSSSSTFLIPNGNKRVRFK